MLTFEQPVKVKVAAQAANTVSFLKFMIFLWCILLIDGEDVNTPFMSWIKVISGGQVCTECVGVFGAFSNRIEL